MIKVWQCIECGYEHEGAKAPRKCPECGADADMFEMNEYEDEDWDEEEWEDEEFWEDDEDRDEDKDEK